jgi:hypothetical protein
MKVKATLHFTSLLMLILAISIVSAAQQQAAITKQSNPVPANVANNPSAANYTYHVFQAPNKMFGYDILQNGRLIHHEFAAMVQPENANAPVVKNANAAAAIKTNTAFSKSANSALAKKEHAEKAAMLAIEKIKRREPPALSQEEIKKIVGE